MNRPSRSATASPVMSSRALFVALSGTGYALTTLDDNSVTTSKIADSAVTSSKWADGTVSGADIAAGAVTGTKVKDGSLTVADLAANSIGDITVRPDPGDRFLVKSTEVRWTEVGSLSLAPGSHLVRVRFGSDVEPIDGSGSVLGSTLECVTGSAVPGSAGAVEYASVFLMAADPYLNDMWGAVQGSATSRSTVRLYCKARAYKGQGEKSSTVGRVSWLAIHVTGVHR